MDVSLDVARDGVKEDETTVLSTSRRIVTSDVDDHLRNILCRCHVKTVLNVHVLCEPHVLFFNSGLIDSDSINRFEREKNFFIANVPVQYYRSTVQSSGKVYPIY